MALPKWLSELTKIFKSREKSPADIARERLHLVIIQDRTQSSSKVFEKIKDDIIKLLSQHPEIDSQNMDFEIRSFDKQVTIIASIPIKTNKNN